VGAPPSFPMSPYTSRYGTQSLPSLFAAGVCTSEEEAEEDVQGYTDDLQTRVSTTYSKGGVPAPVKKYSLESAMPLYAR
jgi:hypothetical protein